MEALNSSGITRRSLWSGIAAAPISANAEAQSWRRPNLLFLFSDQHSDDRMGCSGNKQVHTPVMDQLSSEGIHFSHCFSTSPVCSPYRVMLLSGLHSLRNGVSFNCVTLIPGQGKQFGEALRDSGYRTGYFGKWHILGGNRVRLLSSATARPL